MRVFYCNCYMLILLQKWLQFLYVFFLFQKQEKNASYHGESHSENAAQQKRYITRSTAKKVSKSMSDLMEM